MSTKSADTAVSNDFLMRRLHSLMGLGIVLFLAEHLLTNSRAALWLGDDGKGFIQMVNLIHSLPYLQVIEISLLGIPIAFHGLWGIKYALSGQQNALPSGGKRPSLGYWRNWAYTLQRLTSWFLLVAILLHVYHMRFEQYPVSVHSHLGHQHMVKLDWDEGLYTVSQRLGISLFDKESITRLRQEVDGMPLPEVPADPTSSGLLSRQKAAEVVGADRKERMEAWMSGLESFELADNEIVASSNSFGTIILMNVRDVMKSPVMAAGYTLFVLAAAFHGFNGLWTFLITWGLIITPRSQRLAWMLCLGLMGTVIFLGLAAAWGTYFLNLRV